MGTQTPFRARFGIAPRITTLTSSSNLTATNADTTDIGVITLAENTTFSNPTGTPFDGQLLLLRIKSASSYTIAFGTNFEPASSLSYPLATTGSNKIDEVAARWSATQSKWIFDATTIGAYPTDPTYACRAWVNFNGTGTPAIRASGNVSSITDNGVGDYTINFTTAMPDVNYAMAGSSFGALDDSQGVQPQSASAFAVGSVRINTLTNSGTGSGGAPVDSSLISVIILR
jgi:hypothetical protein